jgi:hypothetical protein
VAVIEAEGLRRTYRTSTGLLRRHALEVEAVRGVSFAIDEGELYGLLGPNGGPPARQPGACMTFLRVFLVGGGIAYRALFNWLHPAIYIPTMLGMPLFQICSLRIWASTAGWRTTASSWSATPCRRRPWPACTGW